MKVDISNYPKKYRDAWRLLHDANDHHTTDIRRALDYIKAFDEGYNFKSNQLITLKQKYEIT